MNVPNEDIPVRVDDKHNVNAEHMEANTKYNPNCCVKNDSDENKTEHSNNDINFMLLMRMMMTERSQLFVILECGLVMLHLITTMKQTQLLMSLLMHLLLKSNFINLDKKSTEVRCEKRLECS